MQINFTRTLLLLYLIRTNGFISHLVIRNSIFRWFHESGIVCRLAIDIRWSRFSGTIGIGLLGCLVVGVLGIKGDTVGMNIVRRI
jgi:hypothetical protein